MDILNNSARGVLPQATLKMMNKFYVYKITSATDNKVYIGKTSDVERRFSYHRNAPFSSNKAMSTSCPKLYNSMRKHGIENFSFEIIASFDTEDSALDAEEKYIAEYDSIKNGFNILVGGTRQYSGEHSIWFGRQHTEETKKKISETLKLNEITLGENNPMFGKTHTPEAKAKIAKAQTGRVPTPEALKKNSEANKGEKNQAAKITQVIADTIRIEYAVGDTTAQKLADKYGISKRMVLNIIHYKNWT